MKEYIPENETIERMVKRIAKPLRDAREMVSGLTLPTLPEKVCWLLDFRFNIPPTLKSYRDGTSVSCLIQSSTRLSIMKTCPCIIQRFFFFFSKKVKISLEKKKDIFFYIFTQNIHCGYNEAVLTSTHHLCFAAKIRKIGILLQTSVFLYKSGV